MAKRFGVLIPSLACTLLFLVLWAPIGLTQPLGADAESFPRALETYEEVDGIWATLEARAIAEPFNVIATLIFVLAIAHTFLTSKFLEISDRWNKVHQEKIDRGEASRDSVSHGANFVHLLGEVEVVFGLWAVPLLIAIITFYGWSDALHYLGETVDYTEAVFVVVIMTLAATRPILRLAEGLINRLAGLLGGTLSAKWFTTLTIGALMGSFITEPAAMTISALVLGRQFYALEPSTKFKYATLALLLVNVSVGGTLTNFAAPPVLMVATPWDWSLGHMLLQFGWKAALGIVISNGLYFVLFRRELKALEGKYAVVQLKEEIERRFLKREEVDTRFDQIRRRLSAAGAHDRIGAEIQVIADEIRSELEDRFEPELRARGVDEEIIRKAFDERFEEVRLREVRRRVPMLLPPTQRGTFVDPDWDNRDDPVPGWVTVAHVLFMAWTIVNAHHPPLAVLGLLFFLGFVGISKDFQNRINLQPAMLVGFFLAGLVIHGGLQGWWIAPILGSLREIPLMAVTVMLTSVNDNAAITYLATLVPDFSDALKYSVVAGAVTGGGLTIIANAPNPAGISLLKKYLDEGFSPASLFRAALVPTAIMFVLFLVTS